MSLELCKLLQGNRCQGLKLDDNAKEQGLVDHDRRQAALIDSSVYKVLLLYFKIYFSHFDSYVVGTHHGFNFCFSIT
jgi:hypothetical protein